MLERFRRAMWERSEKQAKKTLHYLNHKVEVSLKLQSVMCEYGLKETAEVKVDHSRAGWLEGWAVARTKDSYAAECCVDVELCHGTALASY